MSVNIDPKRQVREARVDQAIAEDVAAGMAVKADVEEARADNLAAQNIRQSAYLNQTQAERDVAVVNSAVERESARSSAFGFWLLLGIVAAGLLIFGLWYSNQPAPTSNTTVITSTPATAPATPPVAPVQIQTPNPAPPPPAPPAVIERQVPVAVPVPVPTPARQPNTTIVVQPSGGSSDTKASAGDNGAKSTSGTDSNSAAGSTSDNGAAATGNGNGSSNGGQ